jgi:hypothetical protein
MLGANETARPIGATHVFHAMDPSIDVAHCLVRLADVLVATGASHHLVAPDRLVRTARAHAAAASAQAPCAAR